MPVTATPERTGDVYTRVSIGGIDEFATQTWHAWIFTPSGQVLGPIVTRSVSGTGQFGPVLFTPNEIGTYLFVSMPIVNPESLFNNAIFAKFGSSITRNWITLYDLDSAISVQFAVRAPLVS